MIFRDWKYEDITALAELEKECFLGERWSYETFSASFLQKGFYGILCEGETALGERAILGYGCIQTVFDQSDLLIVAVAEEYRRAGIGRELLSRLMEKAKEQGAEKMFLEVRKSNLGAKNMYRNAGFSEISQRKKYYPDGEDALVMLKNL